MDNCIFCKIVAGDIPAKKVYEDEHTLAFFDINPVNAYHTLVIPKKHYQDIFSVPAEVLGQVANTIKTVTTILNEKVNIKNVQIINNSGSEAQQDVFHLHFHIIPRSKEDGQDIKHQHKPELQEKFNELLQHLN